MDKKIIDIVGELKQIAQNENLGEGAYRAKSILYDALFGPNGYVKMRGLDKLSPDLFDIEYEKSNRTLIDKIRGRNKNPVPMFATSRKSDADTLLYLAQRGALGRDTIRFLADSYDAIMPAVSRARESVRMSKLDSMAQVTRADIYNNADILPTNIITHVTKFLPNVARDGSAYILPTAAATKSHSVRSTVHVFVDGIVENYHGMGADWEDMPYIIVAPLGGVIEQNGKPMVFNEEDTFWSVGDGGLRLPDSYRLVRPGAENMTELYKIYEKETHYKDGNYTPDDVRILLRNTTDFMRRQWEKYSDDSKLEFYERSSIDEKYNGDVNEYLKAMRSELLHTMSRDYATDKTSQFWYGQELEWSKYSAHSDEYQRIAKEYGLNYGDKTAHSELIAETIEHVFRDYIATLERLSYLVQHPQTKVSQSDSNKFTFSGDIKSDFLLKLSDMNKHVIDVPIAKELWSFDNARDFVNKLKSRATDNFNKRASAVPDDMRKNVIRALDKMMSVLRIRLSAFRMIRPKQSLEKFLAAHMSDTATMIEIKQVER